MARGVQVGGMRRGAPSLAGPARGQAGPWDGRDHPEGVLGSVYRRGHRSADGVSYIGDLNVLAALIVTAQLKHQCSHMAPKLRSAGFVFGHPGDEGRGSGRQKVSEKGQLGAVSSSRTAAS